MSDPRPTGAADEHDAWLREALRHAPDAAALPPGALRDAILAEARSAAQARRRVPRPMSVRDSIGAFWSWLARPAVAAGFASVMAATLVGLMWWDRPMDETIAPPPSARSARQDAAPLPPATSTTADTTTPSAATPAPKIAAALAPPTAAPAKRAEAAAAKTAPATPPPQQDKDRASLSAAQVPPSPFFADEPSDNAASARGRAAPTLAKKAERESAATAPELRRAAPAEPPVLMQTPAESARRSDLATNDAKSATAAGALAKPDSPSGRRAAIAPRESADALSAGTAPQAFAGAPAPEREAATSERQVASGAALRPLAALLDSIARGTERGSRTTSSGDGAGLDAATQAWLASVDAATAGRWQAFAAGPQRHEGAAAIEAHALPLRRDGRIAGVVRVDDGGVFFELAPGPAWFAPLPPETVARLRATLPPAGR